MKIDLAVAIFVHGDEIPRAENFILLQARGEKSPGHILGFFPSVMTQLQEKVGIKRFEKNFSNYGRTLIL